MTKATIILPHLGEVTPIDDRARSAALATLSLLSGMGVAAFGRNPVPGHITAAGFILSPDRKQTLLLHHKKLNKWLQPGGHCDEGPDALAAARKEILEEVGLSDLAMITPHIADMGVHPFPARGDVPEHLHFDVRYLFEADPDLPIQKNEESEDVRWVALDRLHTFTDDPAVLILRELARIYPATHVEAEASLRVEF